MASQARYGHSYMWNECLYKRFTGASEQCWRATQRCVLCSGALLGWYRFFDNVHMLLRGAELPRVAMRYEEAGHTRQMWHTLATKRLPSVTLVRQ